MGKTLYLECSSGISGDMSVAAMLDLGADPKVLEDVLASLPLEGYRTEISRVSKSGLDCCDFNVILDQDNHDHDMEYLHAHEHTHTHEHEHHHDHEHHHEHEHHHDHEHTHTHEHEHTHEHSHEHSHRHLSDVYDIIDAGTMTDGARALARKIFEIIGKAEAKAHGLPMDQVGFHEVGAVDSIVDIVAFAVCFDDLDITDVIIPKVCEGTGTVRCQHGILPVPVPAVMNILTGSQIAIEITDHTGEFLTPTGAAIAEAIVTKTELPKPFRIQKVGLGAGKRTYEKASILRAVILQEDAQ